MKDKHEIVTCTIPTHGELGITKELADNMSVGMLVLDNMEHVFLYILENGVIYVDDLKNPVRKIDTRTVKSLNTRCTFPVNKLRPTNDTNK